MMGYPVEEVGGVLVDSAGELTVGPYQDSERALDDPRTLDVEPFGVAGARAEHDECADRELEELLHIGEYMYEPVAITDVADERADRRMIGRFDQDHQRALGELEESGQPAEPGRVGLSSDSVSSG